MEKGAFSYPRVWIHISSFLLPPSQGNESIHGAWIPICSILTVLSCYGIGIKTRVWKCWGDLRWNTSIPRIKKEKCQDPGLLLIPLPSELCFLCDNLFRFPWWDKQDCTAVLTPQAMQAQSFRWLTCKSVIELSSVWSLGLYSSLRHLRYSLICLISLLLSYLSHDSWQIKGVGWCQGEFPSGK